MITGKKSYGMEETRAKLSTLWVFVMFNMVCADILSFLKPETLKELMTGYAGEIHTTQGFLLVAAILLEVPIAMIFLSRILTYKVNRRVNIIAVTLTIPYVILGGSTDLHYIFFATIEVVFMLVIVWFAWKWANPDGRP